MADKHPDDFEAAIHAEIEASLAREMAKKREELAYQARRKIEMAHLDKVNARHPIEDKYGGLGPEGHARRLQIMDAGAKADAEWMDRANARPIEGAAMRGLRIKSPGS